MASNQLHAGQQRPPVHQRGPSDRPNSAAREGLQSAQPLRDHHTIGSRCSPLPVPRPRQVVASSRAACREGAARSENPDLGPHGRIPANHTTRPSTSGQQPPALRRPMKRRIPERRGCPAPPTTAQRGEEPPPPGAAAGRALPASEFRWRRGERRRGGS